MQFPHQIQAYTKGEIGDSNFELDKMQLKTAIKTIPNHTKGAGIN